MKLRLPITLLSAVLYCYSPVAHSAEQTFWTWKGDASGSLVDTDWQSNTNWDYEGNPPKAEDKGPFWKGVSNYGSTVRFDREGTLSFDKLDLDGWFFNMAILNGANLTLNGNTQKVQGDAGIGLVIDEKSKLVWNLDMKGSAGFDSKLNMSVLSYEGLVLKKGWNGRGGIANVTLGALGSIHSNVSQTGTDITYNFKNTVLFGLDNESFDTNAGQYSVNDVSMDGATNYVVYTRRLWSVDKGVNLGGSIGTDSSFTWADDGSSLTSSGNALLAGADSLNKFYVYRGADGSTYVDYGTTVGSEINEMILTWTGGSSTWSTSASNWSDHTGVSVSFSDGKIVLFDAEHEGTVSIDGVLSPSLIKVTGGEYTFTPANAESKITLSGGLYISGSEDSPTHLTISGAHAITGAVNVGHATLTLGNNAALSLANLFLDQGTLNLNAAGFGNFTFKEGMSGTISFGDGSTMGTLTLAGGSIRGGANSQGTVASINVNASAGNDGAMELSGKWKSTGNINMTRGKLTISGDDTRIVLDGAFLVGENVSAVSTILMKGGELVVKGSSSHSSTDFSMQLSNWARTSYFTLEKGSIFLKRQLTVTQAGTGSFIMKNGFLGTEGINMYRNTSEATSSTFTMDGGTTILGAIGLRMSGTGTTTSPMYINLNGGTLGASADWTLSVPAILGGAITFDTTGYSINADTLAYTKGTEGKKITVSGVLSGGGKLVANGAGTLVLTGENTFSGGASVKSGTLSIASMGSLGAGITTIHRGATLQSEASFADAALTLEGGKGIGIGGGTVTANLTMGLNINEGGIFTVDCDALAGLAGTDTSLLTVSGTITSSGSSQFSLNNFDSGSTVDLSGQYILATGTFGSWSESALAAFYLDAEVAPFYSYTVTKSDGKLILNVTAKEGILYWNKADSGVWMDGGDANWTNRGGSASAYKSGSSAIFRDLSLEDTSAKTHTITLQGTISPGYLEFSNERDNFVLMSESGAGALSGKFDIVKKGAASATISTDNSGMSGSIELKGGALVAGHANALGSSSIKFLGGTLVLGANNVKVAAMEGLEAKLHVDGTNSFSWATGNVSLANKNVYKTGSGSLILQETKYSSNLASEDGGTIVLNTAAATSVANTAILSGNIAKTGGENLSIGAALSKSSNLTLDIREGTLVLTESVESGTFNINLSGNGATLRIEAASRTINGVSGKLTMGLGSRLILWNGNYWGTSFGMAIHLDSLGDGVANIDGTVSGGTTVTKAITGKGNLQINNKSEYSNILTLQLNNSYEGDTFIGTSGDAYSTTNLTYSGSLPANGVITPWGTGNVTIGADRTATDWENAKTTLTNVTLSATVAETAAYSLNNNITFKSNGKDSNLKLFGNGIGTLGGRITVVANEANKAMISAGNVLKMSGGLAGAGTLDVTLKAPAESTPISSTLELTGDNTGFSGILNATNAHVTLGHSSKVFGGSINTNGGNVRISAGGQVISGSLNLGGGGLVIDSTALSSGFAAVTVTGTMTVDINTFSLTIDNANGKAIPDVDGRYVLVENAGSDLPMGSISWLAELDPDSARFYSFQKSDGKVYLSIMGLTSVVWVGDSSTGNGTWANGVTGWMDGTIEYANNKAVTFTDMKSSSSVITIGGPDNLIVNPTSIAVSSDVTDYTWQGTGSIGDKPGSGTTLHKSGSSSLTINQGTANTFSGGTTLDGGSIILQSVGGLGAGAVSLQKGNLVLDGVGALLANGNKLSIKGGRIVYTERSGQDISSLIDLASSADTIHVNILQNGTTAHEVNWNTAWNAISRNLTLNAGLAEGESAGQLNISMGANTDSNFAVEDGRLKISLNSGVTMSGTYSGAGTVILDSRNTEGERTTTLSGTYDDFSGKLVLNGLEAQTRMNRFLFTDTTFLNNASSIEVDGVNVYVEGSGSMAIDADINVNFGGISFDGNANQTYKLTGALSGPGQLALATDGAVQQLSLTGDLSQFSGTVLSRTGQRTLFGDGNVAVLTEDGFLTRATSLSGTGSFVFNYSNDASLGAVISGTVALAQAGAGVLTLTGAHTTSGTLTIDTMAVLADGASWAGVVTGAGELTVKNSSALSLAKLSGNLKLDHAGTGVLSINSSTPGGYTGDIAVSGGGSLDLGGQAYSNSLTMKHGSLVNAGKAGNLHLAATGNVDMGGVEGSFIKSIVNTAGIVSNINGNISLDSATVGIGEANMDSTSHPGSAAIVFNGSGSTLTLDHLTLNIGSIEAFLKDHRDEYRVLVTNGTLSGAIVDDLDHITFTPYLADLGYDLLDVEGGYISIDGRTVNTPYTVLSEEEKTLKNPMSLERYPSIFVNGKLLISIKSGEEIIFKKLQSDTWATGAMIDLGSDPTITAVLHNSGIDTSYAGSIIGSGSIVKTGANALTIGGHLSGKGGSVDIREGILSVGGSLVTEELKLVSTGTGKVALSIGGASSVSGRTSVGKDASLSLGAQLDSGSLNLTDNGTITLNNAGIILHDEHGDNVIGSNTSISGNGFLILANGGSLTVSGGSSIDAGIIFELGKNWTLHVDSDISLAGLDGENVLSITNESVVTLTGDKDADFSGTLESESSGSIIKTGKSRQILRVSSPELNLDSRNGILEINRKNITEGTPTFDKLAAGGQGEDIGELLLRTETRANGLLVLKNGVLTLGDADADRQYASVSLYVDGDAVFENGSKLSTIVPNEKGGVSATGTITLPGQMTVSLVNNGSGSITTADDLLVMKSGEGFLSLDGATLASGTSFADWKVTLEKSISLFYSSARLYIATDGKSLMANPIFNTVNTLEKYAQSDTAMAGANMLWFAGIQAGGSNLDNVLSSIMDDIKAGNSTSASHSMAATAGSTVTSMLAAQMGDFRNQQIFVRNRMTTMGLPAGYDYEGELPLVNTWVQGTGAYNSLDTEGDYAGYELNTWGGTFGVDLNVTGSWTLGAAFSASYGDLSSTGADSLSGDLDSYYVNLFARYQHKNWGHNLIVTAGQNDASVVRTVQFGSQSYEASGDTSGSSWGAMYEVTYDISLNERHTSLLQPLFNVSISQSGMDAYEETGAGNAGLRVDDMKATTATVSIGSRLLGLIGSNMFGRETLGELRVQITQDLGDNRGETNVAFQGNSTYSRTVKGAEIGSTGLQVGGGISLPTGTNGTVFVEANADIRSGATSANGSIGYRYNF